MIPSAASRIPNGLPGGCSVLFLFPGASGLPATRAPPSQPTLCFSLQVHHQDSKGDMLSRKLIIKGRKCSPAQVSDSTTRLEPGQEDHPDSYLAPKRVLQWVWSKNLSSLRNILTFWPLRAMPFLLSVQPLAPGGCIKALGMIWIHNTQIRIHTAFRFESRHCLLLKALRRISLLILVDSGGTWLAHALKEARVKFVHVAYYSRQPQQ